MKEEDKLEEIMPVQTSHLVNISNEDRHRRSMNLIDFLYSVSKICEDNYDPCYANVTEDEIIEMDKAYGRHISLEDGLRNPELVAPRTRIKWTRERIMIKEDISYCWYRTFVIAADFANMIPQFRQLPIQDQCQLFRHNFATTSWLFYLDAIIKVGLINGFPFGNGAYAPNDIILEYNPLNLNPEAHHYYSKLLIDPFKDLDSKEISLFMTILLFQNGESCSDTGSEICRRMNEFLIDALWDYQAVKNPEITIEERVRKQSNILLLIPKITQAWHLESDLHLLMSIFGEVNMDGIPKELLFNNLNFNTDFTFCK
uniref:NR LBD domain-containing protein n=1 Tax=Acrobeloides nanus TaxID=290746 RepID=A0A914D2U9_9BILA